MLDLLESDYPENEPVDDMCFKCGMYAVNNLGCDYCGWPWTDKEYDEAKKKHEQKRNDSLCTQFH